MASPPASPTSSAHQGQQAMDFPSTRKRNLPHHHRSERQEAGDQAERVTRTLRDRRHLYVFTLQVKQHGELKGSKLKNKNKQKTQESSSFFLTAMNAKGNLCWRPWPFASVQQGIIIRFMESSTWRVPGPPYPTFLLGSSSLLSGHCVSDSLCEWAFMGLSAHGFCS